MTNQTNLTINVATGSVSHAITTGVEFISEEQYSPAYPAASIGTLCPPTPTTRASPSAAGLPAGAQRRLHARRDTTIGAYVFDTLSFAENGKYRRVPPRYVRHGFRGRRGEYYESAGADFVAARCGRHAVLIQGGRAVQAGAERQRLSIACQFEAASGRCQLHADTSRNGEQREPHRPRAHRGRKPQHGTKWEFRDGALADTAALFDSSNKNELVPDATNLDGIRAGG